MIPLSAIVVMRVLLSAGAAPPELAWPDIHYAVGEGDCPRALPPETRTLLGIALEKRTLDSFERVLGSSALHEEGDAGEFFAWRCWEAENGDGTVLVAGRGEVHEEFRILGRDMPFPARGACTKSKLVSRSLATANGIRLGLTRAQVERRVGPALKKGDRWFERSCLSRQPMTQAERARTGAGPDGAWDVSSGITAVEKDGRVEAFRVTWTMTY